MKDFLFGYIIILLAGLIVEAHSAITYTSYPRTHQFFARNGPALSRRVVCAEVETVYYDAFLGGCRPGDCRYCLDTTKFYQRLHECDPAETLRSHYKELE
jgi:hypothetical protein